MMDQMNNLADPKSDPCLFFNVGDEFILKRTPQQDDFYHLMEGKFCGEEGKYGEFLGCSGYPDCKYTENL